MRRISPSRHSAPLRLLGIASAGFIATYVTILSLIGEQRETEEYFQLALISQQTFSSEPDADASIYDNSDEYLEVEEYFPLALESDVLASQKPNLIESANKNSRNLDSIGSLERPVDGRFLRNWSDKMPGGSKSEGVSLAAKSGSSVFAPASGTIEFVGPFRSYGQLVIISTKSGHHILLSGMSISFVEVGQSVKRGELIAKMADTSNGEPELYLELRRNGVPINPADFLPLER